MTDKKNSNIFVMSGTYKVKDGEVKVENKANKDISNNNENSGFFPGIVD